MMRHANAESIAGSEISETKKQMILLRVQAKSLSRNSVNLANPVKKRSQGLFLTKSVHSLPSWIGETRGFHLNSGAE